MKYPVIASMNQLTNRIVEATGQEHRQGFNAEVGFNFANLRDNLTAVLLALCS